MALVQLSDLIYGESYDSYVAEESVRLSSVFQSGIVVQDDQVQKKAQSGGFLHNMPHWKPLGQDEPNPGSDDPAQNATPKKATTGSERARVYHFNQHWSAADLSMSAIGEDPLVYIGSQVAEYWSTVYEDVLIKTALGILADNDANDSDDMIHNVATDAAGAIAAAESFTGDTFVEAEQTMGDHKLKLTAVAIHSRIHANLQKQGLLQDHFDLETGALLFQTFLGKRVIVHDSMPVVAGANRLTYTSILFGAGAFRFGNGAPKVPNEASREALQGNGQGVELLHSRRSFILHPRGFKWLDASVAGDNPTYAEIAAAANWDRAFARKNIPLAFLKTNA